ncbi:MAG: class I SAM-dependent methyltransferase [Sulfuritalea sp.]|nr:class I SAM-dependent methyltransferase [Sulfuritalea sp.]
MHDNDIKTRPWPACPACGLAGSPLYRGLTDSVFNVPGVWDMSKCDNPDCGTLWLDPMPEDADLPKLYAGYYTHQPATLSPASDDPLRALLGRVRAAYLHAHYGYDEPLSSSWADKLLGLVPWLYPAWKDSLQASVFHLHAQPGGCLLEVGCGSGAALQSMQQKGWRVTGLDFDEGAVNNARSKGLDVRQGQLSAQEFADESFDAVVMSHVIEHVPSPVELLAECRRILKKGGVLVALTPNARSSGHKHYGRNWRGLEPPRHLQIFTRQSLANFAGRVGYAHVETFTTMNGFVYLDLASAELAAGERHVMGGRVSLVRRILSHVKALGLGWRRVVLASGNTGEELVLVCRK